MKHLRIVLIAGVLIGTTAARAAAQDAGAPSEISISYSYLKDDFRHGKVGIVFDFGRQMRSGISVIGEGALNRVSRFGETYVQAGGGVRISPAVSGNVRPFVQTVVGLQRSFGATGFNVQPGGGVNIGLTPRLDARVQFDVPIVRWRGFTYTEYRFSAGISLPLGRQPQ